MLALEWRIRIFVIGSKAITECWNRSIAVGDLVHKYSFIKMPLKLSFIILFLSILTIDVCQAQDTILKTVHLRHNKTGRLKKLKSGNIYEFALVNGTKIKGTIISATDSVISIHTYEKHGNGDNVTLNVSDIKKISSYLIKGNGVQDVFAVALILPALIIIISPLIWITEGGDDALESLGSAGLITGGCLAVISLHFIKRNFDLKQRWTVVLQ